MIPDSVEPSPLEAGAAAPGAVFGMLGRIAPWKGQDLFLRAFAAAFADGEERAVIIGTAMFGEEEYERSLPSSRWSSGSPSGSSSGASARTSGASWPRWTCSSTPR